MFSSHIIEFKLDKLLREATFGKSGYYSSSLKVCGPGVNFNNYHREGDNWSHDALKSVFSLGLL